LHLINVSEENQQAFDIYQINNIYCLSRVDELLGINIGRMRMHARMA
jgi:hypothetical protein